MGIWVEHRLLLFLGVLITGIGDALADAAGFHVSEETEIFHRPREVWKSTFFVFISKIVVVAILLTPLLLLELKAATIASFIAAAVLIVLISKLVCTINKQFKWWLISLEYLSYAVIVVLISYGLGRLVTHFIA